MTRGLYSSSFFSPRLFSRSLRNRCRRVWRERQDVSSVEISTNLNEFVFRAPFPTPKRNRIVLTLRKYSVGLIPFQNVSDRMCTVERPLKLYEYLHAGLGVVFADVWGAPARSIRLGVVRLDARGVCPAMV